MISNSFIFLEGVGVSAEKSIWRQGITDWNSFVAAGNINGISKKRKNYYSRRILDAKKSLCNHDSCYFYDKLPNPEVWRLYDFFHDECLFLDVETSGYYGDVTVVGMYDGRDLFTLVKNRGLEKGNLKKLFSGCKLLVTFNGCSFDVPVVNRCFGDIVPKIPHLDLRFPLAKLGFSGGLKKVERVLGINRKSSVDGLSGCDAVSLWQEYKKTGSSDPLDLLVDYNAEDVLNLKPLADFVFDSLKSRMLKNFL